MRIKLGFVGAGFMGQLAHLRHYASIESCEVVALAETRDLTGRLVAQKFGIPHLYSTLDQMLAEHQLDGVVASQPYGRHVYLLPELFARAPCVFSEKPLALSIAGGTALVEAARKAGTTHMVGYQKRCDPAIQAALHQIEAWKSSGEVGELRYIRVTVACGDWLVRTDTTHVDAGDPRPDDPLEALPDDLPTKLAPLHLDLVNFYVHQLNLIRFLLGESYEIDYADPSGVVYCGRSVSGVAVTLEARPYDPPGWDETIFVAFSNGYVKVMLPPPLAWEPGRVEVFDGSLRVPAIEQQPAFRKQAEAFVAVCRGERAPPSDAADALLDLELIGQATALHSFWLGAT